jgi:hypothetical protein
MLHNILKRIVFNYHIISVLLKKKLISEDFYLLIYIVLRFKLHLNKPLTSYPEAGKNQKI